MFIARIQAQGLSISPAENKVYPEIFRPLIRPSHYHGFCVSAMSILSTLAALVRTLEEAMVCCRLAWLNEMLPYHVQPPSLLPLPVYSLQVQHSEGRRSLVLCCWMVCIPSSPAVWWTLCLYWAQGGFHWVPPCALRSANGWCPAPGSVYKATENSTPYPPGGLETRPPLL